MPRASLVLLASWVATACISGEGRETQDNESTGVPAEPQAPVVPETSGDDAIRVAEPGPFNVALDGIGDFRGLASVDVTQWSPWLRFTIRAQEGDAGVTAEFRLLWDENALPIRPEGAVDIRATGAGNFDVQLRPGNGDNGEGSTGFIGVGGTLAVTSSAQTLSGTFSIEAEEYVIEGGKPTISPERRTITGSFEGPWGLNCIVGGASDDAFRTEFCTKLRASAPQFQDR